MKDIDDLLERYFEGKTSLPEEKILRYYFLQDRIEDRHKVYRAMFNFFSEEKNETLAQRKRRFSLPVWVSIAAGILLLIGVWSLFRTPVEKGAKSLVYVDGKEITDTKAFNAEILNSIETASEIDEDMMNTQIGILDSFTE